MEVLGIRFCSVSEDAEAIAGFLSDGIGLPKQTFAEADAPFAGAIFPAGDSWIEVWPHAEGMPSGVMLQIVVDDADAWAEQARANGLEPSGPMDDHGERIYFLTAPDGLPVSFQSKQQAD